MLWTRLRLLHLLLPHLLLLFRTMLVLLLPSLLLHLLLLHLLLVDLLLLHLLLLRLLLPLGLLLPHLLLLILLLINSLRLPTLPIATLLSRVRLRNSLRLRRERRLSLLPPLRRSALRNPLLLSERLTFADPLHAAGHVVIHRCVACSKSDRLCPLLKLLRSTCSLYLRPPAVYARKLSPIM